MRQTTETSNQAQKLAPDCAPYTYGAEIVRVIDGDQAKGSINLGFNTWRHGEAFALWVLIPLNEVRTGLMPPSKL